MLSLYHIWTIAKIEAKTLYRSWFFRIFAALALFILFLINTTQFTNVAASPWMFRGIPASIPYMNLLLLNIAQAIVAIFLASDFLKRDRKLDTTEVIYMRSMTNGDYVLGKSLGVLLVFLSLNILVLLMAAIFNIFFSDVAFQINAYFLYPLIISIPTLIFIIGISFFLMVLIKNQAVTFLVLLGYIALTLFFLGQRFHHLFDYMGFFVPMMYSDFIGFGDITTILIHRSIYLFLGFTFIFSTIYLIRRLPQSRLMTKTAYLLSFLFLILSIIFSYKHVERIIHKQDLRNQAIELCQKYADTPLITPTRYNIQIKHLNNKIVSRVNIVFQNNNSTSVDKYIFTLNPGLKVYNVTRNNKPLKFQQNLQILEIQPEVELNSGEIDSLTIEYQGTITENLAYLDVTDELRTKPFRIFLYNIDKRYGFVKPQYVLLTPEINWYPISGVRFYPEHPEYMPRNFPIFKLTVETSPNLLAISQGNVQKKENGTYIFHTDKPVPWISLTIGPYVRKSVQVDSIEYALFTLKNHNYFEPYFNALGDTLNLLIRELKQDFEAKLDLSYPYNRLLLVETPIQFYAYPRLWTISQETVQPEIVFLPENGILLQSADFKLFQRFESRRRRSSDQVLTKKEIQSRYFRRFVTTTFTSGFKFRFRFGGIPELETYYTLFPNYYTFTNYFESKKWPIFNMALESYINSRIEQTSSIFAQLFEGLTDEEKTNQILAKNSLEEILKDPEKIEYAKSALKAKSDYLFTLIQYYLGQEKFEIFVKEFLEKTRFQVTPVSAFLSEMKDRFNYQIESYLTDLYKSTELPAFIFGDIQAFQVVDQDRTRYQIIFKVTNVSNTNGLIKVTFRSGRRRGFMGPPSNESEVEKIVALDAHQTKQVGIILDNEPRGMRINTLISQNLPSIINQRFEEFTLNEKAQPFDGEKILDEPVQLAMPNEIIVDNEDPGFEIIYQPSKSALLGIIERFKKKEEEEKYIGIRYWQPPKQWKATTFSSFFGWYIQSAHFIKSGGGEKKVAWNAEIKEPGFYDIYYYVSKIRLPFRKGRDERMGEYHFYIYHEDGIDETILNIDNAEPGWNFLGSFYLSKGKARVELSDKCNARVVFADAVKWVKR